MNLRSALLITVLLLLFGAVARSQPPKPVLIDEFGTRTVCEEFGARVDWWIQEVTKTPDEVGYALVSGPNSSLLTRLVRRDWIEGQLKWRFGKNSVPVQRFVIVEAANSPELLVRLFRSEKNDATILSEKADWDLNFPLDKPFAFYQSAGDGGICPAVGWKAQFFDLLDANPNLRGHIVFHERSAAEFRRQKKEFLNNAIDFDRSRLRFFQSQDYSSGHYELWLVPIKSRK